MGIMNIFRQNKLEIHKLILWLSDNKIDHYVERQYGGVSVKIYLPGRAISCISHYHSYGGTELIEYAVTINGRTHEPLGNLDADTVIKLIVEELGW